MYSYIIPYIPKSYFPQVAAFENRHVKLRQAKRTVTMGQWGASEVARIAAEGVAAGRAKRAVTVALGATEVARSASEGAAAGVGGAAPGKFLHIIYPHQALLVIENSFQIIFLQPKSMQFSK